MNKNALHATLRLPTQAIQEPTKEEPIKEELPQKEEEELPEELLQKDGPLLDVAVLQEAASLPEYPTYQAGRLNQVILPDGTILKPVDGIYTATTEAAFDMLNYYSEQDIGLVSKLF